VHSTKKGTPQSANGLDKKGEPMQTENYYRLITVGGGGKKYNMITRAKQMKPTEEPLHGLQVLKNSNNQGKKREEESAAQSHGDR